MGGDLIKYSVDNAREYLNGEEVGDFDLVCSLKGDLVWTNLPGRYIFERFDKVLKNSGSEFNSLIF